MRILLTEGAGLTSRQVATRLDHLGHDVSAAVSDPVCLARFTRHVRTLHRVPTFGTAPLVWFDRLLGVAAAADIDVIFPTQEQVTVLSHQLPRLLAAGLVTAVPPFASLEQVQDKLAALRTLARLQIPQPHTLVVQAPPDATEWNSFPAYVRHPSARGRPECDASPIRWAWPTPCVISWPLVRRRTGGCWCKRRSPVPS
jgi:hypothetical protein